MTIQPINIPPRRRWFRFSLRTLLALVVVMSVPIGWIAQERRQSRQELQIAQRLREQGYSVVLSGPGDVCYGLYPIPRRPSPPGWRDLVRYVLGRRIVCIAASGESNCNLELFAGLTELRELWLFDTQISDLRPLANLTKLQELDLCGTRVRDLRPLAGLINLRWLDIQRTQVSGDQVSELQRALPNCRIRADKPLNEDQPDPAEELRFRII